MKVLELTTGRVQRPRPSRLRSIVRRLVAPCAALALVALLPGQRHVGFVAPVNLGDTPSSPTEEVPMAGIRVALLSPDLGTFEGQTDAAGVLTYPAGYTPERALILGLANPEITVYRNTASGAPSRGTASIPVAPGGTYDITAYPSLGPAFPRLTREECAAFYHVQRAHALHGSLIDGMSAGLLHVYFQAALDQIAEFKQTPVDTIFLHTSQGQGDPTTSVAARSGSILAHEYGHRIVRHLGYQQGTSLPRMREGLADFLASMVTDSNHVGLGVFPTPRDLDNGARYSRDFNGEEHHDGLVIGGALYHARELFRMHGRQTLFDNLFASAIAWTPEDETDFLLVLLYFDENDGNRANCTPNTDLLYHAFVTLHGIPWPTGTGYNPTLSGTVTSVLAGWSADGGPGADLRGSLASGSRSLGLQATFRDGEQRGFFLGSLAPATPLQLAPGLRLFLDLGQVLPPIWFDADRAGRARVTLALPPGIPDLAFHGGVLAPTAPLGVALTNGVRVVQ